MDLATMENTCMWDAGSSISEIYSLGSSTPMCEWEILGFWANAL